MNNLTTDTRKCTKCHEAKNISDYYLQSDGRLYAQCKKCICEQVKKRKRTKKGIITAIYAHQRESSRQRNYNLPEYTVIELQEWCFSQPIFHELYSNWVDSGFKKKLTPSVDRINDYKSYSIENIQIMTWDENNKKGGLDQKKGNNRKQCSSVIRIDNSGKIKKFFSQQHAMRELGVCSNSISACCNDRQKTAGGFRWQFFKSF